MHVDSVVVQGNQSVPGDAVVSLLQSAAFPPGHRPWYKAFIGYSNMFMWPDSVPTSALAVIPQLASVSIGKNYFTNTVTASVAERQPFAIWCFMPKASGDERCFWFDQTGTLFQKTFDTQGNLIEVVHDYSQDPKSVNEKILPDQFAANMISVLNVVQKSGVNVSAINVNDLSLEEISVVTVGGPTISFSLRFPADADLQVIQRLVAQGGFDKLQYIDCRTENRVYYK